MCRIIVQKAQNRPDSSTEVGERHSVLLCFGRCELIVQGGESVFTSVEIPDPGVEVGGVGEPGAL